MRRYVGELPPWSRPASDADLSRAFSLSRQAIVLTYEGAGVDMITPYFSHRLKPLQPLTVYGRVAKQEPKCPPCHAVWYAWKDVELSACREGVSGHAPYLWDGVTYASWELAAPRARPGRECWELAAPRAVVDVESIAPFFVRGADRLGALVRAMLMFRGRKHCLR